ncbi:MAG TPA: hypothetical protein P5077_07335 [bacterium]|nr:hypothetical protein [bacterium]
MRETIFRLIVAALGFLLATGCEETVATKYGILYDDYQPADADVADDDQTDLSDEEKDEKDISDINDEEVDQDMFAADDAAVPDDDVAGDTGFFPVEAIWYQDISQAPKDAESDTVIANLAANGGWGNGDTFQIDFSIEVLYADGTTLRREFFPTDEFYSPDCDQALVPVPDGGVLEGEEGYRCLSDGDCHLIVLEQDEKKLYEMWRADIQEDVFFGGCMAVWDLTRLYGPSGRGDQCTSADAAGYPIAPLLFTADEVVSGEIAHAIRFILPNQRIRNGVYVHPATHSTNATAGGVGTIPYGARLRLKSTFNVDALPSEGAKVVARALQKYGMFLADGGQIALTGRSDRTTTAKWDGLLDPHDLSSLKVTDFEMVEGGDRIPYTGDCIRIP